MKKVFLIVSFLFVILIGFILYTMTHADTRDDIIKERKVRDKNSFDLAGYLQRSSVNPDSILAQFPYVAYSDSANIWSIKAIRKDLTALDDFNVNDKNANRQTLSLALTNKLASPLSKYYDSYQPDSLLRLMQWAEKFQAYSEVDTDNDILYLSIYEYWMDILSNKLAAFSHKKPSLIYDYKFSYLRTRLVEKRYAPSIKVTSKDKFFLYLINGEWGHLISATSDQASGKQKFLLAMIGIIMLCGVLFIGKMLFNLIKKIKSKENG